MVNDKPIIKSIVHWLKKHYNELPRYLTRQLSQIEGLKEFCKSFPTCDGCPFWEKHIGCKFRGKTPREW